MTAEKREKTPTFEEALAGLEQSAEDLRKESITLEDAMKCYERGIQYYNQCSEILSQARQKIEVYDKSQLKQSAAF